MKVRNVVANLRKKQLELTVSSGAVFPMPFAKLRPRPTAGDPIVDVYVDPEFAREGVTYTLASKKAGSVLLDHALYYNRDPGYLADLALYELTCEARDQVARSGLSRRELARRLGTSVPQIYRLLDQTYYGKSFRQIVSLFQALDCDVHFTVRRHKRGSCGETPKRKAA